MFEWLLGRKSEGQSLDSTKTGQVDEPRSVDVPRPLTKNLPNAATDLHSSAKALAEPLVIGTPTAEFESRPARDTAAIGPYRPDTVADGWSDGRLVVRAASLRGWAHRYYGEPRQDDFALDAHPEGRLFVAVADGVSSAPYSHLGATTVVRHAVRWLMEHCTSGEPDWGTLMQHAAWTLVEQATAYFPAAAPRPDAAFAESRMATTLVCAVVDTSTTAHTATAYIAGVGDSDAWLFQEDKFVRLLGATSSPEDGITSTAVSGLPRVPGRVAAVKVSLPLDGCLLLATDGFGDPLGDGDGMVGQAFSAVLRRPPSLHLLAHTLDFSKETFDDDRTLVAVWHKARASAEMP